MINDINENQLLAALAKDKNLFFAVKELKIKPWIFRDGQNRQIYAEISRLVEQLTYDTYKPAMMATGYRMAQKYDRIMKEDASEYIKEYQEDDYVFLNRVTQYREESRQLHFFELSGQLEVRIAQNEPFYDLLGDLEELQDNAQKVDAMNAEQIAHAIETETEGRRFKTGIDGLDDFVKIQESHLVVLAGESSAGKTSLAMQLIYNFIRTTTHKAVVYSLETTQTRLGRRIENHIGFCKGIGEDQAHEEFRKVGDRLQIVSKITEVSEIEKSIRDQIKKDDTVKFICIDYLQIIDCAGIEEEIPRVSKVVKQLHQLAQEIGIVLLLLCQLKKEEGPKKDGKKTAPTFNSLRGSGQITNSADIILINWYENTHHSAKSAMRDINIEVPKQKEGAQGRAKCKFVGSHFTFIDAE